MNRFLFQILLIIAFSGWDPNLAAQTNAKQDTLYERLKRKNVNEMTQREYEYFMLMKRKEVDSQAPVVHQQGVLTGVVTYFFNRNYGDKPDVGSEVFIVPEKYEEKWHDAMSFLSEVLSRANAELSKALGLDYPDRTMPRSDFEKLQLRLAEFIDLLRDDKIPEVRKVIADGAGTFSVTLSPGQYCLIGRSAHRNSYSNKVELLAQIDVKIAEVKASQSTSVKLRFQAR